MHTEKKRENSWVRRELARIASMRRELAQLNRLRLELFQIGLMRLELFRRIPIRYQSSQ